MIRIVLANDGRAAWLEALPEVRVSFKHEGEIAAFAHRAAEQGFQLVADATAQPPSPNLFLPA